MLRTRDDVYQPGLPAKPGEHYGAFVRFASEKAGSSILDLGCGYGAYSLALAAEGRQCVGGDVNMKYLKRASSSGLPVVAVDSVLPFPDRSFDTVMLLEVIEHVPQLESILSEAFRVARRNVLITVPNAEDLERLQENDVTYGHMLSSDHVHSFDPASLEQLLGRFAGEVEIRRGDPVAAGAFPAFSTYVGVMRNENKNYSPWGIILPTLKGVGRQCSFAGIIQARRHRRIFMWKGYAAGSVSIRLNY